MDGRKRDNYEVERSEVHRTELKEEKKGLFSVKKRSDFPEKEFLFYRLRLKKSDFSPSVV